MWLLLRLIRRNRDQLLMVNSENEDEGAALREDVINNPKLEPVF
jgi:hypothetical protein